MKKISEIMTRDVDFVTPLDNVYEVAVKMKQDNVGVIPVCENGQVMGVITDRDIVMRGVAEKRPGSTKVTDIMSEELYTGSPEMSVQEAAELMADKQIRRLPIGATPVLRRNPRREFATPRPPEPPNGSLSA